MRYEIKGEPLPVVEVWLDEGEAVKNESGSMVWMTEGMEMSTNAGGGIGKAFGRMFSGESVFQSVYTAKKPNSMIAFGSSFAGSIVAVEVTPDKPVIAQKSAFLASSTGVEMSIHFQKKLGAGFLGGEGFIMQKFSGSGIVFLEIDGSTVEYELAAGEKMILDNGYLAMMDATVTMEIETVKGLKNIAFGGEGLTNTVVTGPGKIVLQTMPIPQFARSIIPYIPTKS